MSRKRKRRSRPKQRRNFLAAIRGGRTKPINPVVWIIIVVMLLVGWMILRHEPVTAPEDADLIVYANASCKCHRPWVRYLKRSGLAVSVVQTTSVTMTQAELGVPREFSACHTASVNGYWLEGHVPVDPIKTLMNEKPSNVRGLAYLRAEAQTEGMLTWEVVTYGADSRPISSEAHVSQDDESNNAEPHDP